MEFKELLKEHRDIGLLRNPEFDKARKIHDWRNHVPSDIQENWRLLTSETKIMVYLTALKAANREVWEE